VDDRRDPSDDRGKTSTKKQSTKYRKLQKKIEAKFVKLNNEPEL